MLLRFEEKLLNFVFGLPKKKEDEISKPREIKPKHTPPNHTTSGKMSLGISPVLNAVCVCVSVLGNDTTTAGN